MHVEEIPFVVRNEQQKNVLAFTRAQGIMFVQMDTQCLIPNRCIGYNMEKQHDTTIQDTIVDQLRASKVNGFPFFAYTGIKDFVMEGEDTIMFKKIPRNPSHITNVVIIYDFGRDSYRIHLFQKHQRTIPYASFEDIYFDQMAHLIAEKMGVL